MPFPVQAGGSPRAAAEPAPPPPPSPPFLSPPFLPCGYLFPVLMSCPSGLPLSPGETGRNKRSLHHDVTQSEVTCPSRRVHPSLRSRFPVRGGHQPGSGRWWDSLNSARSRHEGSFMSLFYGGCTWEQNTKPRPQCSPPSPVLRGHTHPGSSGQYEEGGMNTPPFQATCQSWAWKPRRGLPLSRP